MAVAAKRLLGKNKWPELLQFVYLYSQSQVEEQRELAFIILNELAEALGKSFEGQFAQLKQVYQGALHDASSRKVHHNHAITRPRPHDSWAYPSLDNPTNPPEHRCKWRRSRRARRC